MKNYEINRLDKLFGPSGSFAGFVILLAGLVALYFSLTAIFLVLIGAFAGFTTTCAIIDYAGRSVRYTTAIFGFIHTGKWIGVEKTMTLKVQQSGRNYRAYSRSNRVLDIRERDFSIVLKDENDQEICPLKRFSTRAEAEVTAHDIALKLGIQII